MVQREFTWDDLFPYQEDDRDFVLKRFGEGDTGIANFSQMGVGKTPCTLAVAEQGGFGEALVVCPSTLKYEWYRQIGQWCGKRARVARDDGARRLDTLFDPKEGAGTNFFVINYESFRKQEILDVLSLYPFDLLIMDEAHKIRNRKIQQTKGMFSFMKGKRGLHVLTLTGSPLVNNPADVYPLLCLIRPEEFELKGWRGFVNRYCLCSTTRYGLMIFGERNIAELRGRTTPYTIRRTRKEVLPFLPETYYRKVILEMTPGQRRVYSQVEHGLKVTLASGKTVYTPDALSQLTRLRQISADPRLLGLDDKGSKINFIMELIEDYCVKGGRKLVIFSCFSSFIDLVDVLLNKSEVDHVVVTGDVKSNLERARRVKRFQEEEGCWVFLGTVQTAGEGITLTAASDVVFADRWWTPATMEQAESRLIRIGQKNAVQVIILINQGSVDESVERILERKAAMIEGFTPKGIETEVLEDLKVVAVAG
jgi:SNF2 family DNA or RNA helicase